MDTSVSRNSRRQVNKKAIIFAILLTPILLYFIFSFLAQPVAKKSFFEHDGVMVMAHAGGKGLWPDNTLFAMSQAVDLGVDVLEMDIQQTAEGVIVLRHDDTVDAYTEGSGKVNSFTFNEIQKLDAAYKWTTDKGATYPFRGQGITISSLEEVLATFPNMKMNIEMKPNNPAFATDFCQLLRTHQMTDKVLVASFHSEIMTSFRSECPEVATSGVESEIRLFFGLNTAFLGATYQPPTEAFQVPEYSGGLQVVTKRFVGGAHKKNVAVHVWTVNEETDMQRLIDLGVDGIITDYPDRLLKLLGRE